MKTGIKISVVMMLVGGLMAWSLPARSGGKKHGKKDIVDTAMQAGNFKNLVQSLQKTGLAAKLKQGGPYTVFAPTDEAFDKLPEDTLKRLLMPENRETLKKILTYHVVPGRHSLKKIRKIRQANTLQGQPLHFVASIQNKMMVEGARITRGNLDTSNGIIHVVDSVILPRMALPGQEEPTAEEQRKEQQREQEEHQGY